MPYPDSLQIWPTPPEGNHYVFPQAFTAGDSINRPVISPDFKSSDGWALSYSLRGGGTAIDLPATANGDDFTLTVTTDVSALWQAGRYSVQAYVTKAATNERHCVYDGFCDVAASVAGLTGDSDTRSHARRMLDLIEALLEGRASNDILVSGIDQTHFQRMGFPDMQAAHSYYTAKVRSEEAKARAKAGLATGRTILTRFVNPA